MEDAIVKLGYS